MYHLATVAGHIRSASRSSFLGAFAKLKKGLLVSSWLSVRMEQLFPMSRFSLNWIFEYLSKICRKNSSFIKIGQEERVIYMKTNVQLWWYLAQFLKREIFRTTVVERIKTHFAFNFFFENFTIYEKMWKNVVEADRPQMTIWRLRNACWIPKATNTLRFVILLASPLQQWLHEPASLLHYTYIGLAYLFTYLVTYSMEQSPWEAKPHLAYLFTYLVTYSMEQSPSWEAKPRLIKNFPLIMEP